MVIINKEYVVDVDSYNYTLKRKSLKEKDGKEIEVFTIVGYYGDLAGSIYGAMKDSVKRKLNDGEHSLSAAIDLIRDEREKFEKCLQEKCTDRL